jgi:hypothetical protein
VKRNAKVPVVQWLDAPVSPVDQYLGGLMLQCSNIVILDVGRLENLAALKSR